MWKWSSYPQICINWQWKNNPSKWCQLQKTSLSLLFINNNHKMNRTKFLFNFYLFKNTKRYISILWQSETCWCIIFRLKFGKWLIKVMAVVEGKNKFCWWSGDDEFQQNPKFTLPHQWYESTSGRYSWCDVLHPRSTVGQHTICRRSTWTWVKEANFKHQQRCENFDQDYVQLLFFAKQFIHFKKAAAAGFQSLIYPTMK